MITRDAILIQNLSLVTNKGGIQNVYVIFHFEYLPKTSGYSGFEGEAPNLSILPDDRVASFSNVIFIGDGSGWDFINNFQRFWKCFGGQDGET